MSLDELRPGRLSFFSPRGYQRNSCGYCGNERGSISYYAASNVVRVEEYEELIKRGWRRSGMLYYKQNLQRSCCPHYTVRLDPTAFKPSKDQRRAVNRWTKFVLGPEYIRNAARLCPKTREEKKRYKSTFDLCERIHEAEYSNVKRPKDPKTKKPIEPAHRFEVNIESDSPSLTKYEVFLKYQTTVHKDPPSRWKQADYRRFLCSGISKRTVKEGSKEKKLGSYHQVYRLDGKVIAVAVLDLLPNSVSSVYVYYDPEYEQFEFGKLTALREIALALETPYEYYYMGFYIHSCQKMRYKANFRPQYLLDPESLTWDPLDDNLRAKLDKRRYVSLSRDRRLEAEGTDPNTVEDELFQPGEEEISLFDVHMPGVLTLEELRAQVDLDHWRMLVQGELVELGDLVGWERSYIKDPQSIKGIAAELAAVLGPKVVKTSVMVLFFTDNPVPE
ncbi:hypothetical protein VTO42DRAFT_6686 [Malbranchea cinnamomea]